MSFPFLFQSSSFHLSVCVCVCRVWTQILSSAHIYIYVYMCLKTTTTSHHVVSMNVWTSFSRAPVGRGSIWLRRLRLPEIASLHILCQPVFLSFLHWKWRGRGGRRGCGFLPLRRRAALFLELRRPPCFSTVASARRHAGGGATELWAWPITPSWHRELPEWLKILRRNGDTFS